MYFVQRHAKWVIAWNDGTSLCCRCFAYLIDSFYSVTHRKLIGYLLSGLLEAHLPAILPSRLRQLHLVIDTVSSEDMFMEARVLNVIRSQLFFSFDLNADVQSNCSWDSRLVSTFLWKVFTVIRLSVSSVPRLYHTSISPESVRTSMTVCPRKSSDSLVNFCRNFDFRSLSSSHTRTLMRSVELWHSLKNRHNSSCQNSLRILTSRTSHSTLGSALGEWSVSFVSSSPLEQSRTDHSFRSCPLR